ncbi:putative MFS-type transporter PB1E7,08c [Schizosaccharomyces pombe 972h-] [Rhizoctonia solani]|uniref:Putative MFS-type transporter PB1E7,08c [Schizosaccharomyces pombe 972h-] n=1 Tax=Rhizoctonia solani TaxID=456999 RepID=A0A0K6G9E4_9AGAM|nr:putative MFS-type transporter PB1E7,08c [Schizosaccharomyces pombe 972h-] [Rhizoctonia solani]
MITPQARRQASEIFNNTHSDSDDIGDGIDDMRSPLDRTIDKIGMGPYQWALLALCGFGWAADNMWLQAIAIILPRVQDEYAIPDSQIGVLSASMFCGMMFGALGWGSCSDVVGRSMAFNLTLAFTSLFGIMACLSTSFGGLCFLIFLLGSAVGGSMPTDGTLFLENVPKKKQYLLTALSVFFSLGAVVSAIIAIIIIPGNSCPEVTTVAPESSTSHSLVKLARILVGRADNSGNANTPQLCDVTTQNKGWKYLLGVLGIITLVMFVLRIIFFRLYESPRYLVSAGRNAEAVAALQSIEDYNVKFGRSPRPRFVITLADVCDAKPSAMFTEEGVVFDAVEDEEAPRPSSRGSNEERKSQGSDSGKEDDRSQALSQQPIDRTDYRSTSQSPEGPVGQGWSFHTPMPSHTDQDTYFEQKPLASTHDESEASTPGSSRPHSGSRLSRPPRPHRRARSSSSVYVERNLPSTVARPISAWLDRVSMLFTPEWRLTTILVWCAWWGMSLAFTMFNVYLPKLLEKRLGAASGGGESRKEALWDIVIFTLGGCPGALIGAWMIESPLGRRKSLALSTFITALCCLAFVQVESKAGVVWSTVGVSLASSIMWAVLYGMTPEIFDTKVRGTACGTASALNRVGGMIAPVAGGILLDASPTFPVYASIVVFLFSVVCVLLLPFEKCPTDDKNSGSDNRGDYSALH